MEKLKMTEDPEWFWERLLQCIEEQSVIPVIGSDLLLLPLAGQGVNLYSYLAERLASELHLPAAPLPASGALHEVACRFKAGGGNVDFVYSKLKTILCKSDQLQIPEALRKLARIRSFNLFVSLTFDSLLERAINEERFAGEPRTRTIAYHPAGKSPQDGIEQLGDPVILHLFGKLSAVNEYAVTEEDILEFVHSLQADDRLPDVLSSLNRKSLLLLGSSFPDWLTRFFLRIGSGGQRLSSSGRNDVIADFKVGQDSGLAAFLEAFSPETKIFDDPFTFVDELHDRWAAAQPKPDGGSKASTTAPKASAPSPGTVGPGAIFLSYAHEDEPAARDLRDALAAAGMDVWFDKSALRAGDSFEADISRAIRSCCLFVPLISRHTLTQEYRFFRIEWAQVLKLLDGLPPNRRFLVPVAIDDTPETSDEIPDRFRVTHWGRLPADRGTLVELLLAEYRSYRLLHRSQP